MNFSKITINQLLIIILFILMIVLPIISIKLDFYLCIFTVFTSLIYIVLNKFCKDSFIPKIYLTTTLFHFLVVIFLNILKYHILNLPTIDGIAWIGIDNDNITYNAQAIKILNGDNSSFLFYSYLVSYIYRIFGISEIPVCFVSALISGFIPIILYKITKKIILDQNIIKLFSYIIAFSFTIAAYTSVMMRDVYIMLFSYLIIYLYSVFQEHRKILYLFLTLICFVLLCLFRAYAGIAVLGACICTHLYKVSYMKFKNKKLKINKYMIISAILSLCILVSIIIFQSFLKIDYIISLFDMETILKVSEVGYGGANSSFGIDRIALAKCLPLFLLVGYACMFFAPFPHQWLLSKNIVQAFSASETILLYIFLLPSFFIGIYKGFKNKNFIIIASFLYILFVFTFYGMILDNSGAVFRGRAPFIPLIYLISFYYPKGVLYKIICKFIKKKEYTA